MKEISESKRSKSICTIKYSWLIISVIIPILILTSCTTPSSVRNAYTKKSNNQDVLSDNEKKNILKVNKQYEEEYTRDNASENDIASIAPVALTKRKIPSLREQMKIYADEQEIIKNKVSSLETDVNYIKTAVNEIKNNFNNLNNHQQEEIGAVPGDNKVPDKSPQVRKQSTPKKDKSNIILSDEKANYKKPITNNSKSVKKELANNSPVSAKMKSKAISPKSKNINSDSELKSEDVPVARNEIMPDIETGMKFFRQKNYESAIVEFNKSSLGSKDQKTITMCNYWLGESHFGMKQFDKAIIYFQKVIKSPSDYKHDNAQLMLAESYIRIGNLSGAKSAFKLLVENYPKSIYVPRAKKMLQQL